MDFLKKDLKNLPTPLQRKTVETLETLQPVVARRLIRNGTASNYDLYRHGRCFTGQKEATPQGSQRGQEVKLGDKTLVKHLFPYRDNPAEFDTQARRLVQGYRLKCDSDVDSFYRRLDRLSLGTRVGKSRDLIGHEASGAESSSGTDVISSFMQSFNEPSDANGVSGGDNVTADEDRPNSKQTSPQNAAAAESLKLPAISTADHNSSASHAQSPSVDKTQTGIDKNERSKDASAEKEELTQDSIQPDSIEPSEGSTVVRERNNWLVSKALRQDDEIQEDVPNGEEQVSTDSQSQAADPSQCPSSSRAEEHPLRPSDYRHVGWRDEMGRFYAHNYPTSFIEHFHLPVKAGDVPDYTAMVLPNGFTQHEEAADKAKVARNDAMQLVEANGEAHQELRVVMAREARGNRMINQIIHAAKEAGEEIDEDELDCDSISSESEDEDLIQDCPRNRPFADPAPARNPTMDDYMYVASRLLPRDTLEEKLLRMQKNPAASTCHQVHQELCAEVDNSREGRRMLTKRIDFLSGLDEMRGRLTLESSGGEIVGFSRRRRDTKMKQLHRELVGGEAAVKEEPEETGSEIRPELLERINQKLREAGLPSWTELERLRPEDPTDFFQSAAPVPSQGQKVEYRKVDHIGILHRPFHVEYHVDQVTRERIARPVFALRAQLDPGACLRRHSDILNTGHFSAPGEKFTSAGHELARHVKKQGNNHRLLHHTFYEYLRPRGALVDPGESPFDSYHAALDSDPCFEKEGKHELRSTT